MELSKKGIDLIKEFEGCRLTAYQDVAGVWTIGYGTTSADKNITGMEIKQGLTITKTVAENWLKRSLDKKYGPNVMYFDKIYHWNQNQYDALVSFAYNLGSINSLVSFGRRTISEISEAMPLYNKAYVNGRYQTVEGLVRRRLAEKQLFDTPAEVPVVENAGFKSYKGRIIAKSGLNVRKEPNTSSGIITALAYGTEVKILQESNGWGQIQITINSKKKKGWISLKYVSKL